MWLHISLTTFLTWINKQQTFFWWQPYTPVELNNNNSKGLRFSLRALQENYFPSACWTLNPLLLIKASQPLKSFLLQASLPSAFLRFSRPHNIPKSSVLPCLTSHFDLNKKKKNSCGLLLWLPWYCVWHRSPRLSLCTFLWTVQNLLTLFRFLCPSLSSWFSCSFEVTPGNS